MSDSVTLWAIAHQAPLSKGSSSQEYWSGLPCPPPGDPPDPGMNQHLFYVSCTGRWVLNHEMSTTREAHLNFTNWKNGILSFYKFISSFFVDSKSTANMSRSTGLFRTRPYQGVNISRNLQYFPPLRWHVYPSRIVCETVTSIWDIKLRSCFHATKIQLKFLLDFSFLILRYHLLRLSFS